MKRAKVLCVLSALLCLFSMTALANGLNLNGFGARAVAMGGAYVGLANDFTAIFWNPAGMAQLSKKTFGFSGDFIIPPMTYQLSMGGFDLVNAKTKDMVFPSGLVAYYHPVNDRLVAGIGVSTPSGLGAHWKNDQFVMITNNQPYEWESYIGVIAISPGLAYKLSDKVFVGATLDIKYGFFNIQRWAGMAAVPIPVAPYVMNVDLGQYQEKSDGWGIGGTLGLMVKPSDVFSFGATLRTPSKVTMSGDAEIFNLDMLQLPTASDFTREVTQPLWFAAGVAVNPTPNLTFTADAQYTNWDKMDELEADFDDPSWKAFMGATGGNILELKWSDKIQWRFGAEYRFDKFAVRGGYYNDPAPAPDEHLNVLLPNFDFNGFTFGVGYQLNNLRIGITLEHLRASDRDIPQNPAYEMPGLYKMKIWTPIVSLQYGF